MAAVLTGRDVTVAYEQTPSTWGTAIAPTALDGLIVTSVGPLVPVAEMHPDDAPGYDHVEVIDKCRVTVNPEIVMPLRFTGRCWSFIAHCMGLDNKTGEEDPYTHTMTMNSAIDGSDSFGTLAVEVGTLIHEWQSVKVTGFTLEGPDDKGFVTLTVRTIADDLLLGADATTDGDDFDNVTYMQMDSAMGKKVPSGALRFRMNTDAGALDADDNVAISSFSLSMDRGFEPEWVNRQAYADEWKTAEPIESGSPVVTLGITLNDYSALTHNEAYQDETTMKAELYFGYDATHYIQIDLPLMKYMPPEIAVNSNARIPQQLNFQMMKASANPTGMSSTIMRMVMLDEQTNAYE